jgi:hypothetical protein
MNNSRGVVSNFKFSISTSGTALPEHTDEIDPQVLIVDDDDQSPTQSYLPNKIMRKQRTLQKFEDTTD